MMMMMIGDIKRFTFWEIRSQSTVASFLLQYLRALALPLFSRLLIIDLHSKKPIVSFSCDWPGFVVRIWAAQAFPTLEAHISSVHQLH